MSTLTGVLVDVSGSMRYNIDGGDTNAEAGPWVRSIFKVIDELIRYDVSSDSCVFGICFGGEKVPVFDLITTLKGPYRDLTHRQIIERSLSVLEENRACFVRKWASVDIIESAVSRFDAAFILHGLESDENFRRSFINDCLPSVCREQQENSSDTSNTNDGARGEPAHGHPPDRHVQQQQAPRPSGILAPLFKLAGWFRSAFAPAVANAALAVGVSAVSCFKKATKEDIEGVIAKVKRLSPVKYVPEIEQVTESSIFSVHDASGILHGCVGKEELTNERAKELIRSVEEAIYGYTPIYTALKQAVCLFKVKKFTNHKKLLFVLSDGVPTDNKDDSILKLKSAGVTVVCCYITHNSIDEPKRLYNVEQSCWEKGAKIMFGLSSTLTTQLLPRTIFIKRGWKIDIQNNETKLFVQINHPDIIDDVCDLARNVVCCQDSMSDILSSVSLDLYINHDITGFQPKLQEGGTCYANASAAVLHLAMKRILGRDAGSDGKRYPDFFALRKEMIEQYGTDGAHTHSVLRAVCPKYRLRCKAVDIKGALRAIVAKRPVVARYGLTIEEKIIFGQFYLRSPTGILTKRQIDITQRQPGATTGGHAVVLVSFNSQCLRLMNSWGTTWGDMGFFRIENADVLGLEFFDVFWELDDLSAREKAYYERHGKTVAAQYLTTLKGLQHSKYKCPLCHTESLVTEFTGILSKAQCPKCKGEFPSDEADNILALNMYLTSLSQGTTSATDNDESRETLLPTLLPP